MHVTVAHTHGLLCCLLYQISAIKNIKEERCARDMVLLTPGHTSEEKQRRGLNF